MNMLFFVFVLFRVVYKSRQTTPRMAQVVNVHKLYSFLVTVISYFFCILDTNE